jgi:hypothetical protein
MPFTTSFPGQTPRSHSTSASVSAGSNTRLIISATVPSVEARLANSSGSVVSRLTHQCGCRAPSRNVRIVIAGGMDRPLCTSRRRSPATGVSTVSMIVS